MFWAKTGLLDLMSQITDAVHREVAEWQMRLLDDPVIFLDALVQGTRDGGKVRIKAAATCCRRQRTQGGPRRIDTTGGVKL